MQNAAPKCEDCKYTFSPKKIGQAVLFECPSCKTTWVPNIILKKFFPEIVFEQFRRDIKKQQIGSSKKCPACSDSMAKVVGLLRENHFDSCPRCEHSLIDVAAATEITGFAKDWEENRGKVHLNGGVNPFESYFLGQSYNRSATTEYVSYKAAQSFNSLMDTEPMQKLEKKRPLTYSIVGLIGYVLVALFIYRLFFGRH